MTERFICFDIGGTKIFKAVVEINFAQRNYEFLDSENVENPVEAEEIEKIFLKYCDEKKEEFDTNKVAISTSKIVSSNDLTVDMAEPIYGREKFSFKFLKDSGYQVVLENDGKSFVLGEYYFDKNEDVKGLLTLTLGSGIGGGFINSEGQVLKGADNSATEFSHIKMLINGKWECWENISVGRGIEKIYKTETSHKKSAVEIFEISDKDENARKTIDLAQEYLGMGITNLVNIFNPEKIVFGGNIAFQREYIEGAMKIVEDNIFYKKAFPEWSISDLKAEMNILGVCVLYYI